ncbi:hypothetical protein [Streptomyces sp. NBC_01233]|uniref:hypothetical protein n=1 Tax=Streptomyces sp. NBC_01233 TaxID=2903787 RepID=UPI002E14FEEC|nr:hypothetical protein OG332_47215 [Streptomyces sp. NBC_01233]
MNDDFGSSYLERSWEAPEDVILRRELVRTPGLQPEDLGVLAELLLRDPRLPSTMEAIRKDLQARGWKMGKDRYNAIAGRLTKAGQLARISVYDEVAQRPTWITRVYRNPANNQQYIDLGLTVSLQVSAAKRETSDPGPEAEPEPLETRVSPAPRRNTGNPPSGSGWRKTRDLETRVSPARRRIAGNPRFDVHPPLPPGEEDSSPPYPLTAGSLPSQRKEAQEFSLEEIRSAEDFLQQMQQWQAGLATARKSAPKLLSAMRAQGWPALTAMDDCQRRMLEDEIFKNTTGAASWVKCLPLWVADLRRYRAPAPAPATQPGPAPQDLAGLRAVCPACDQYGWAVDGDDDGPMRRCSHPGITVGTIKELR